ncbi:MAG: hypothetical protein JNK67_00470 [Alphaproteobacteria bacterium]|nr:hypothetical protein [Alphaproteobacteria bacterium]
MSGATKVRLLAWLHLLLGGAGLGFGIILLFAVATSTDKGSRAGETVVPIVLMLSATLFLPAVVGGWGLLRRRPWARPAMIVFSLLEMLAIPVGTVIGLLGLWILLGRDAAAAFAAANATLDREAKPPPTSHASAAASASSARAETPGSTGAVRAPIAAPAAAPDAAASGRGGVLLAMAGVAAGFVVAIDGGFMITGAPAPVEIAGLFYPALAVLVVALAFGVRALAAMWRAPRAAPVGRAWSHAGRADLLRSRQAGEAERRARLAQLAADPTRRRYVALIERGESWSDAQIAYDLDAATTATCAHLQPVERAIRAAGIKVRRWAGPDVGADCMIDTAALARRFVLPASVRYEEPAPYDRATEDSPVALLRCAACRSSIIAWHPSVAAGGPVFPAR